MFILIAFEESEPDSLDLRWLRSRRARASRRAEGSRRQAFRRRFGVAPIARRFDNPKSDSRSDARRASPRERARTLPRAHSPIGHGTEETPHENVDQGSAGIARAQRPARRMRDLRLRRLGYGYGYGYTPYYYGYDYGPTYYGNYPYYGYYGAPAIGFNFNYRDYDRRGHRDGRRYCAVAGRPGVHRPRTEGASHVAPVNHARGHRPPATARNAVPPVHAPQRAQRGGGQRPAQATMRAEQQ